MGVLLLLVALTAWRAISSNTGAVYFVAAFFAIAAQAVWSAAHLTLERLSAAVAVYAAFGLVSLAVPVIARRRSQPLTPAWGGGVVLILGLVPLVLPFARSRRSGCAVGAGAASGHHQRRALHRKRGRPPAGVVAGREPLVVGCDGVVVAQRRGQRRRAAVAPGGRFTDARNACRPQLVRAWRSRRAGGTRIRKRRVSGAHRAPVPAATGAQPDVGAAAVAALCCAGGHDTRHERRGALHQGRNSARRWNDRGRGRDGGMEWRRRVAGVGNDRRDCSRLGQRLRAPVASACIPFRGWALGRMGCGTRARHRRGFPHQRSRGRRAASVRAACRRPCHQSRAAALAHDRTSLALRRRRGSRARVAGDSPVARES